MPSATVSNMTASLRLRCVLPPHLSILLYLPLNPSPVASSGCVLQIYLTCPLPPFDRFVALSGYKSDAAPASINVTVWHGGRSPYQTSEVVFSGISGGNELTMNGLRAPPPPSPASPPPAPPAPPPPAIQPSCLKWKQSDPSLSGYKIKKISLSSGNTDVLCDFSVRRTTWHGCAELAVCAIHHMHNVPRTCRVVLCERHASCKCILSSTRTSISACRHLAEAGPGWVWPPLSPLAR